MVAIIINLIALILLLYSYLKNKKKTKMALKKALIKGLKLAPQIIMIIVVIGFIFAFIPPDLIRNYLGGEFNLLQVVVSAAFGAVMMIPSLIALPLAGSLIEGGASYTPVAAFITTLTMVGFVTIPIELKELGKKITIYRNILALIFSIIIAALIGGIM
ncbi:MAG: permease [Candidatus Woesearchaeota archaeon]